MQDRLNWLIYEHLYKFGFTKTALQFKAELSQNAAACPLKLPLHSQLINIMKREEARRHYRHSSSKEEPELKSKRSNSPFKRPQYLPELTKSTEKSDSSSPTRSILYLPEISKPVSTKTSRAGISQFFPKKSRDPLLTPVSSSQSFSISPPKMLDLEERFNFDQQEIQSYLDWYLEHTDNNTKAFSVDSLSSFLETFLGVTSSRLVTLIYNYALQGQDRRDLYFFDILQILNTLLSFRRPKKFIQYLSKILHSKENVLPLLSEVKSGPLKWIARQSEYALREGQEA